MLEVAWSSVTASAHTNVYALAIDPDRTTTPFMPACTAAASSRAANGGKSWSASVNAGLTNLGVLDLAIDPADPATLYAGTRAAGSSRAPMGERDGSAINTVPDKHQGPSPGDRSCGPGHDLRRHVGPGVFKSTNGIGGTWLLPSSAHSPGASGAFYTTNVAVANVGAAPASFTMKFLGHDQDGSGGPEQTFNLEPAKSVTYFDVLGSVFHETSAFGAIRITSDTSTLNIASVTSTPGFGGTLSQTIPAVSSSDLIPAGSSRSILYIREGDGFRSNLVLASNASVPTTVDAALVSPAGETLASKSYSVPPNGMTQINRFVRDMGVSGSVTGARLVLSSSTPGAAFTAFASVIDESHKRSHRGGGEMMNTRACFFSPSRRRSPRPRAPDRASGRAAGPTQEDLAALAIDPTNPARLYAATVNAIYKSTELRRHLGHPGANRPLLLLLLRPGHQSEDPYHGLRRIVGQRGLKVHRRRRNVDRPQRGIDEPGGPRLGHRSLDP